MALLRQVSAAILLVYIVWIKTPGAVASFSAVIDGAMALPSHLIGGNQRSMPLLEDR